MHDHEERFAPFNKIIEYENDQLKTEIVPMYRQMLALFTEKYHLAAPETRAFYQEFLEFVELWNRWLAESLPGAVMEKLDHREGKVQPFYEQLEFRMQQLQNEIAQGRSEALRVAGWLTRACRAKRKEIRAVDA